MMQNCVFLACGRCEMINKSVGEEFKKKNLHRDTDSLTQCFPDDFDFGRELAARFEHVVTLSRGDRQILHSPTGRRSQNIYCCFFSSIEDENSHSN